MSDRKDSEFFCREKRRKNNDRGKNCNTDNLNENLEYIIKNKNSLEGTNDIFTIELAENDPLWRIRAYVIGFLLADGYLQCEPRRYRIIVPQHAKDKNILDLLQKALGGKIKGPTKKGYFALKIYDKELAFKLLNYGMVQRHSKEEVAKYLLPPEFIQMTINGQSLIRDFIRGFFDGDGWFTGTYKKRNTRFEILGPYKFVNVINNFILNEIPNITTSIYPEKRKIYIIKNQIYIIHGKLKISVPGRGYYKLTSSDLKKGRIEIVDHPWLKVLYVAGSFNCIKFFNWMYEDNDYFDKLEIKGIRFCGERKFKKSLKVLGNQQYRKERLAPDWKDVLPEVIPLLKNKFYNAQELMDLTNTLLRKRLEEINLRYMFQEKKANKVDLFRKRLKYLEFFENLIVRYQSVVGRINYNYYHSTANPPNNVPTHFKRKIELVDRTGFKMNIKNLIVYLFLLEKRHLQFDDILKLLRKVKILSKWAKMPKRVLLDLAELKVFNIIIAKNDKDDIKNQKFILNYNILKKFYETNFIELEEIMREFFLNNLK